LKCSRSASRRSSGVISGSSSNRGRSGSEGLRDIWMVGTIRLRHKVPSGHRGWNSYPCRDGAVPFS